MTRDQLIRYLERALNNTDTETYRVFYETMRDRNYRIWRDGNRVTRVENSRGTALFRDGNTVMEFYTSIASTTRTCLAEAFDSSGVSSKGPVIVGKEVFLPFPDSKLAPASAP